MRKATTVFHQPQPLSTTSLFPRGASAKPQLIDLRQIIPSRTGAD